MASFIATHQNLKRLLSLALYLASPTILTAADTHTRKADANQFFP